MTSIDSAYRPDELFALGGKVAIVTGAASGIGLASAEALAAAGAKVALVGLGDVEQATADLVARGMQAEGLQCDVTDPTVQAPLVDAILSRWGRLDVVFANAGAALDHPDDRPAGADFLERFEIMFDLHVRSVMRLADAALPAIADAGGGAFLVMSSLSGLRGNRLIAGYGMTKAANAQLARNLAVQWGARGVRVNAISPGVIGTDFARPIVNDPDASAARISRTPLGRFGTPAEVAGTVVWLASPAGAFVTGQNIVVDGGTLISD